MPGRGFGGRLRDARNAASLTQAQLAEAIGLSQAEVSRLENSKRVKCGWDVILAISRTLHMDPHTLVGAVELDTQDSFDRFLKSPHGVAAALTPQEIKAFRTRTWWGFGDREPEPSEWYQFIQIARQLEKKKT